MNQINKKYTEHNSTTTTLSQHLSHQKLLNLLPNIGESPEINTLVFGTASGSIGVLAMLPFNTFKYLDALQKSMSKIIVGIGDLAYNEWRFDSVIIKYLFYFLRQKRKEKQQNVDL
jgi:hypothetical protein